MANEKQLYKELERGKVLVIEIEADTRNALLAQATIAVSQIMAQQDNVKAVDRKEIEIIDDTDVEMMQDMLEAALNVFRSGFIWRDAEVEERGGPIVVFLSGEQYDPDRHALLTEIEDTQERKLVVENKDGKWRARITFDISAKDDG
jgi:SHS2 domain-containing protein